MVNERGSMTIMAITAMLILAAGSASYAYIANRNVNIAKGYSNGLQAQYSAEAAVKAIYVAGQESTKATNGWNGSDPTVLNEWITTNKTPNYKVLALPRTMGSANVQIDFISNKYNVQALSTVNGAARLAYNSGIDFSTTTTSTETYTYTSTDTVALIKSGSKWDSTNGLNNNVGLGGWTSVTDPTTNGAAIALSPGYGGTDWQTTNSTVLFNDTIGLANYSATKDLQLIMRVNYYVTLTQLPALTSGSGYGIYYLAKKTSSNVAGDASKPTAYIVQFDPGLHPDYNLPSDDWLAWGASKDSDNSVWPYGAFLVKKARYVSGDGGAQNEVWDENSGYSYNVHYGFQDNAELTQRYYDAAGNIQPTLDYTYLSNGVIITSTSVGGSKKHPTYTYTYSSPWASSWALQPAILTSKTTAPAVTQVPTAFGYNGSGTLTNELTEKYRTRPPDLRIAYTLGNIAEGNPWQANTKYPLKSKVAVGVWVDDALNKRLVWVATAVTGPSGTTKPVKMTTVPSAGDQVKDGGITWTATLAPTPLDVANAILSYADSTYSSLFSLAKTSMSDLKFRVDSVNGVTQNQTKNYNTPFAMIQGNRNKISIELWGDNKGNRVHVIRVNDVVMLGFNDRAGKINDIISADWEKKPTADPRSTGIRVWSARAQFYTADNYGQTMTTTTTTTSNYGGWGK